MKGAAAAAAASASSGTRTSRGEPFVDHYGVLGITASATTKEIHDAYRALARLHHPDHDKSDGAAARFEAIAKAYRVLRDPESREAYDVKRSVTI
jgi:DnaJ-class molecular chaperone